MELFAGAEKWPRVELKQANRKGFKRLLCFISNLGRANYEQVVGRHSEVPARLKLKAESGTEPELG